MLPSVGLVDAMRVSSDTFDPTDADNGSNPLRGRLNIEARAWQQGRLWVNDSDCLVARPGLARREAWAAVIEEYGGLRSSSDRIADLDDWGLATTRPRRRSTTCPPTTRGEGLMPPVVQFTEPRRVELVTAEAVPSRPGTCASGRVTPGSPRAPS